MPDVNDLKSKKKIAMVTGLYPTLSMTFVDREVRALRQMGCEVFTCSVRDPDITSLQGVFQRDEALCVFRILANARRPHIAARAVAVSFASPIRLLSTLWLVWLSCPPGVSAGLKQVAYLFEAIILSDHLKRQRISHLHNHLGDSSGTVAMLASNLSGIPFSITLHGPEIFFEVAKWRLDLKIARAKFVACISDFCKAQASLVCEQQQAHKLHVVRCGVDPEMYSETRGGNGLKLLFVGRLEYRKGVDVLLNALRALKIRHPQIRLTVAGDGLERPRLESLSRHLGIEDSVQFTGALDEDGIADALQSVDILIVPSLAEGLPVVIFEAFASCVPVVASTVAGIPEAVIHRETGLLVPPCNSEALSSSISSLLSDPNRCRAMGLAGRSLVLQLHDARRSAAILDRLIQST